MSKPDLSTYGGRLRDLGYAGEIVDQNPATMETRINSASTAIDFGYAVARAAGDNLCKAPAADTDKIIGISVRHAIRPASADGNNTVNYAQYDAVPVLKEGYIYAVAGENVTRGDTAVSLTANSGKLGGSTASLGATSAAKSGGNTGTGTFALDGTTPVLTDAIPGVYTLRCTVASANAATFRLTDPKGRVLGDFAFSGSGATVTVADQIKGVITDGGTDFIVGDGFDITVGAGRVPLDGSNGNIKATWETTTASGSVGVVRVLG